MALVRCGECSREVSDKAATCPNCGAPVDLQNATPAPDNIRFEDGLFVGTSLQLVELAKKAIGNLNYRVDGADASVGTVSFTTGVTMGSWSGVSGTISWQEKAPYRFEVTGQGKQNVQGGQVVALNLFDEANAKARKVIGEMTRLAGGPADGGQPQGSCLVLLMGIGGTVAAATGVAQHFI
jgi:hypothetical protein